MLDEEMDHMIRDAAENHHPAYNDKAWEKMEKMLDTHLPQKRDGRKYIFFLLLFLLLGGGVLLTVYRLNQNKGQSTIGIASTKINQKQPDGSTPSQTDGQPGNTTSTVAHGNKKNALKPNSLPANTTIPSGNTVDDNQLQPAISNAGITTDENVVLNKKRIGKDGGKSNMRITNPGIDDGNKFFPNNDKADTDKKSQAKRTRNGKNKISITVTEPENETMPVSAWAVKDEIQKTQITEPQIEEEQKANTASKQVSEKQKEETVKTEEKPDKKPETVKAESKPVAASGKKKTKNNIAGNFGITLSAGPDVSFIKLNKLGKVTMLYGAGLSYTFKNRVTLRTGFYTSDKIYDASPEQYHSSGGYYPYLYNIAAECRIYEIPVSISYHFAHGKKHNWFGNVGLSSFIMKSEYYEYEYKTPGGQYYNYETKIRNENKHYFSVLALSAGYQYALSKRILLQAEPYIKIPLGGVGVGKVKLNSSGLLFTATIKPFAKK